MKLSTSKIATSKLATYTSLIAPFEPVEFEGLQADFVQSVGFLFDGALVQFQQNIENNYLYDGFLCNLNESVVGKFDGVIGSLAQTVLDVVPVDDYDKAYPFASNIYGDFGRFGIEIKGSGIGVIDACTLFDKIVLKFEEGKASIAEFSIAQDVGTSVDLFKYLNQDITIELTRPSQGNYVIYSGKISHSAHKIGNRFIAWTATQSRDLIINKMTEAQVSSIGYFNANVFRELEEYKNNVELLADKMKTIPAALEFINNTPTLVSWFVKDSADYTLNACDILRADLNNDVNSQDNIINSVTIKVQYQYDMLYQADRSYMFDSQYTVCDYATHGMPPSNDSIRQAVTSTGWVINHYDSIGLHEGGVYRCSWRGGYPAPMIWSPRTGEAYIADPNDPDDRGARTVINLTDVYANSARFTASKRWTQPIEEILQIVKQNTASIERYEERKDEVTVTINQDRSKSTNRTIRNWDDFSKYSNPQQFGLIKQANGYWTRKIDDIDKGALQQAIDVANRVADVMILESHRTIETSLVSNKIAPQFNVSQTHNVVTENLNGKFKVYRIEHTFDCVNKNFSRTSVVYKLFSNKENQPYQMRQVTADRADIVYYSKPEYNPKLGVHDIAASAQIFYSEDEYAENQESTGGRFYFGNRVFYYNLRGLINKETRELTGVKFYEPIEFQFIADEIEEESTDAREFSSIKTYEMSIPNDEQNLVI